jgi:hypothetical protein
MRTTTVTFEAQRIRPHLSLFGEAVRAPVVTIRPSAAPDAHATVEDLAPSTGPWSALVERLGAARDRWAQLTFYLFDPESWR